MVVTSFFYYNMLFHRLDYKKVVEKNNRKRLENEQQIVNEVPQTCNRLPNI